MKTLRCLLLATLYSLLATSVVRAAQGIKDLSLTGNTTFTGNATLSGTPTGGTLDFSHLTLTLPPSSVSAAAPVQSVAGRTGAVTLTKSDVGLSAVENTALSTWPGSSSFTTAAGGLLGTAAYTSSGSYEVPLTIGAGLARSVNTVTANVTSVAGRTGAVTLTTADAADSTNRRYVTDAQLTIVGNTSGTNTGDQDLSGLVPKTTTVNGHALSANVTVSKSDVGLSAVENTALSTWAGSSALTTGAGGLFGSAAYTSSGSYEVPLTIGSGLTRSVNTVTANVTSVVGRTGDVTIANTDVSGLGTLATQNGTFSGTSSGTNTGDQTNITGNAGTATVLQNARTINGVSFDGSGNITVTAAGSTLSDTVTVAKGGTGTASYNQGDILYASATTTFTRLAKSTTASRYLKNSGTNNNPAWAAIDINNDVSNYPLLTFGGGSGTLWSSSVMHERGGTTISSKTWTLLTSATPADLTGSFPVEIPSGFSRWRLGVLATNAGIGEIVTETSSGTLTAATIEIRTASAGGGTLLNVAIAPTNTAGNYVVINGNSIATLQTASSLVIRQTVNSAAAGTISIHLIFRVLPVKTLRLLLLATLFSFLAASAARSATPLTNAQLSGADNQVNAGATLDILAGGNLTVSANATLTVSSNATVNATWPLSNGGTGSSLSNPGATRFLIFNASGNTVGFGTAGTGLTFSGNTIATTITTYGAGLTASGNTVSANVTGAGTGLTLAGGNLSLTGNITAAPDSATYITQTASGNLSAEQALGALATGLLKNTTTTGVLTIATAGADYVAPGALASANLTMSTARLLGRTTASTGAIQEITVLSPLSLSSGNLTLSGGTGDVVGPAGAVDSRIVAFDTTTGKLVKDGGKTIADINPLGLQTIWMPAAAMIPSTTNGCASLATVEITAGQPDVSTLDFDPSTEQYAQFAIAMPKSWNLGTITVQFLWSHAATTTNFGVVWGAQALAVSDGDAIGASFGTAQTVADTGGTTDTLYISSATSAITIAGTPAAGDHVFFRIYRKAADGSDTMAINARLHGIRILYTISAPNDN